FAGRSIQRNYGAPRSRRRIHHAIDEERRSFEHVLRPWPERVGLESPRDFELIEIFGVDPVQGRIACIAQIAAGSAPLAACCSGVRRGRQYHPDGEKTRGEITEKLHWEHRQNYIPRGRCAHRVWRGLDRAQPTGPGCSCGTLAVEWMCRMRLE